MFRHFERRWERLSDTQASDPALLADFRRDQLAVWAVAIGVPFLLAAVFRALVSLAYCLRADCGKRRSGLDRPAKVLPCGASRLSA